MRVSPARRRRWNNIMILLVILFIGVLNLPTIIKSYLIPEPSQQETTTPFVFNPQKTVKTINFTHFSLQHQQGQWHSTAELPMSAGNLARRWLALQGTVVDDNTFTSLSPHLGNPATIEVWYNDQVEPQRITFYRTAKFWLFQNWQNKWVAISVAKDYIMPAINQSTVEF